MDDTTATINVNLNAFSSAGAYYEELVNAPPKGVDFCGIHRLGEMNYIATPQLIPRTMMFLEAQSQKLWNTLNQPSLRPALRGDIVHSNRLPLTNKPYVISFDHVGFLTDFDFDRLYRLADEKNSVPVTRYLLRSNCNALLPWSEAAANGFQELFGSELSTKMEVVYPAVQPYDSPAEQSKGSVELLFVATNFYLKGGMEVIESFSRLRKDHDVSLTIVADVPSHVRKDYNLNGVNIKSPNFSRQELYDEIYSNADLLVHPTHNDSFGMVLLEAMNAGLPIVATRMFAIPEIVNDKETGLLVDRPEKSLFHPDGTPNREWNDIDKLRLSLHNYEEKLVRQLTKAIETLTEDYESRVSYGRSGRERVLEGRFSIENRNKKLSRIYRAAKDDKTRLST